MFLSRYILYNAFIELQSASCFVLFLVTDFLVVLVRTEAGLKTEKICKYFHLQASAGYSIDIFVTNVVL